jgi:hypothetical protein
MKQNERSGKPKEVKGYLADDGTFFQSQPECERYNAQCQLFSLCESHSIHPENFMTLINSWHQQIREYLNADSNCKSKQANGTDPTFEQSNELPSDQADTTNARVRDKDAKGFLEQSFGVDK